MDASLWKEIITPHMAGLAAGVIAAMLFIGRIPVQGGTAKLNETKVWKDWGLFLMFGLSLAGSFMPGIHDVPYAQWGGIIVFGATTAMTALIGRALLKPFILARLEGKTIVPPPPKE